MTASRTFPPQVSLVLDGISGFCGVQPRTVIDPPSLAGALLLLPPVADDSPVESFLAATSSPHADNAIKPARDSVMSGLIRRMVSPSHVSSASNRRSHVVRDTMPPRRGIRQPFRRVETTS